MYRSESRREPLFNLPSAVVAVALAMVAIHGVRAVLPVGTDLEILALFAFVPDRLMPPETAQYIYPGGEGAKVWTFLTYALLHADWAQLLMNTAFFGAIGAVVCRRFGAVRFVLFSAVTAVGAVGLHLATHWAEAVPVVGASGIVSGLMGALLRFAFVPGGPLAPDSFARRGDAPSQVAAARVPAMSLGESLVDGRVLRFVIVFLVANAVLVFGAEMFVGPGSSIAWEAHLGGFAAGFLAFSLFDPIRPLRR